MLIHYRLGWRYRKPVQFGYSPRVPNIGIHYTEETAVYKDHITLLMSYNSHRHRVNTFVISTFLDIVKSHLYSKSRRRRYTWNGRQIIENSNV